MEGWQEPSLSLGLNLVVVSLLSEAVEGRRERGGGRKGRGKVDENCHGPGRVGARGLRHTEATAVYKLTLGIDYPHETFN